MVWVARARLVQVSRVRGAREQLVFDSYGRLSRVPETGDLEKSWRTRVSGHLGARVAEPVRSGRPVHLAVGHGLGLSPSSAAPSFAWPASATLADPASAAGSHPVRIAAASAQMARDDHGSFIVGSAFQTVP
jgi:hypothetical protein